MRVADAYSEKTAKARANATLREAAELLSDTRSSDLMVVADDETLLGVVSEGDLIRAVMPSREEVLSDEVPLLQILDLIEEKRSSIKDICVTDIMTENPITVTPEDPLLKAAQIMTSKMIHRLPVVVGGKLIGSLSRADICLHVMREHTD